MMDSVRNGLLFSRLSPRARREPNKHSNMEDDDDDDDNNHHVMMMIVTIISGFATSLSMR